MSKCWICERAFFCGIEQGKGSCWCFDKPRLPLESALPEFKDASRCLCPMCYELQLRTEKLKEKND